MIKSKKMFIITLTFLMLVGLTAISATDTDGNDTITEITQSNSIDTITDSTNDITGTSEDSTSLTDEIQDSTNSQETINGKTVSKTQNLKADRTETATNYTQLNSYLTDNAYDTVTIDIGDDIRLAGNIAVNAVIKTLTINGNGKTINGSNQYRFLSMSHQINLTINNLTVTQCRSTANGGAIYSNANSNITLTNTVFKNNYANNGGVIYSNGYSNISLTNTVFTNNNATNYGGAIYANSGNLTLTDSNFTNNKAYNGGGIYTNSVSYLTLINAMFTNNNASSNGGAICTYSVSYLTLINSTLSNNKVAYSGYGGAIWTRGNITVTNSTLTNNTAYFGAAIYSHVNSNITITNTNITNNNATYYGGAIYGNTSTKIIITESNITNNNASYSPVIYGYSSSNITVTSCNFSDNGGGIYGSTYSKINVTDCVFSYNYRSIGGSTYSNINVTNCNFSYNKDSSIQGDSNSNINVTGCDFSNNNASTGGAIYFYGSRLIIANSTFTNNTAYGVFEYSQYYSDIGGGAIFTRGNIDVINCNFTDNYAGYDGGAIYVDDYRSVIITNSNFINNNAVDGGAIYGHWGSNIKITNSNLTNNYVSRAGGAVYLYDYNYLTITNSTLKDNNAPQGGAISANYGSKVTVTDSNIINNNATDYGGAISGQWNSNITLTNINLTNNNANYGGAIYLYKDNNLTVTDTNLRDNNASIGGGAVYAHNTNNITVTSSNITNNNGTSFGGALYARNETNLTITDTNISDNCAESGGALYVVSGNTTVTATNLTHNNATAYGGAIYLNKKNNLTVTDTNLADNNASYGGAIYTSANGSIKIENANLTDNRANYGGAVYTRTTGNVIVTDVNIKDNNASIGGGAIYAHSINNITVINSNITDNNASSYAGAIYARNETNIRVTGTNLKDNTAESGGALYVFSGNINVADSNITDNTATKYGGAIYTHTYSNITVTGSEVTGNIAPQSGGAVYAYSNSNIILTGDNFSNNNATLYGGAVYANGNMTVTNTNLTVNTAESGGAIYAPGNSNITLTTTNLNSNNATKYGGAVYIKGDLTATNTKFTDNTAESGGAVYAIGIADLTITNFTDNSATQYGGAIYIKGNLTTLLARLTNNTANSGGAIYIGSGNISMTNSYMTDNCVNSDTAYVLDFHNAGSISITSSTFTNNTDNTRDMLFSNAKNNANVDIHSNNYVDNFLEDTILKLHVANVTDNEREVYNYYVDVKLREIYNDTVRSGTLNVYVNGVLCDESEVFTGRSRILFGNHNLTNRENNITLEFISHGKDYQNTSAKLTVKKEVNTTLSIQAPSRMNSGYTAVINFTLVDVNGNPLGNETIHVMIDKEPVGLLTTDRDGIANYTFKALGDEIVRIEATYYTSNDSYYLSAAEADAEIVVGKLEPEILITAENIVPLVENEITIKLFDADGNPIRNKKLTVNITEEGKEDITQTVITDRDGIATFKFTPTDEGKLNINVTSPSDDLCHYASETVEVSKNFITTNMLMNVSSMKINQTNTINIEIVPSDGELLRGTVQLDIDGEIHNVAINYGSGTYTDYKSATAGEKLVTAKFISSTPGYANVTTTKEFNVEKLPTRVTIEAVNTTAGNVTLKVLVFPEDDIASIVDGGNIVIESIDGENSIVIYNDTLENGELIYLTGITQTGWYEFGVQYHGNDYFLGEVNNTGSVEVTQREIKATVTVSNDTLGNVTIEINVVDPETDEPIPNVPVVITLPNGTNITGTTDENGTVTIPLDISTGDNNITITYPDSYNPEGQGGNITVKVKSYSVVTVDAVEGVALDNVTFTANVLDYQNKPVNGGYVIFKVGGKTLTDENENPIRVYVENGKAVLSYRAESGWIADSHPNLSVQATYSGTSTVAQNRSKTSKVIIYKRNATVTVTAPDDYVNGTLNINAEVRDQKGSLVRDGNIVFKLNGISLKDENNKAIIAQVVNGKVHLYVKLPFAYSAKEYNLTAVYSSKTYNKATGSNTTNLKPIPTYINATVTIEDEFSKPVVTGQVYNQFNNAILEGTATINIKFDGKSYTQKIVVNNGTFTETIEDITIYKPGTHKVDISFGNNSHYQGTRQTFNTTATPKYNVTTEFTKITRNKTSTRVQAKIVDDQNRNVQKDLTITIKLNGVSYLTSVVTNGNVDVEIDTSKLSNKTYIMELISSANTYYNAGKATTELPKY